MKELNSIKIIAIDHGYGNIKTANCCFPAGLTAHSAEPAAGGLALGAPSQGEIRVDQLPSSPYPTP